MRRVRARAAQAALARAEEAARWARIPALAAEVDQAVAVLDTPAARLIARGEERPLRLEDVEALLASKALVIDACRNLVRERNMLVPLASRPVLFALARTLGEAWPGDVPRDVLLARAFGAKHADESHRARLRVEIGRLRRLLRAVAGVSATKQGFALSPRGAREVVVLARPVEEEHAAVLAFLADGEVVVELGARARARHKPAHGAAGARLACRGGQGAGIRPRPGAALDDPAAPGIHDDLVTPGAAAGRAKMERHEAIESRDPARIRALPRRRSGERRHLRRHACLVRGRRPADLARSGERKDAALDRRPRPCRHRVRRQASLPDRREPHPEDRPEDRPRARHDSRHPAVAATRASPGPKARSGSASTASARSTRSIPETGAILRTIESNRFVTGVTWVDGELWHGTWEGDESDLRRIDPQTGEVLEQIEMPRGIAVSGLESDGGDQFFCGGGSSGKVRAVRRPNRGPERREDY